MIMSVAYNLAILIIIALIVKPFIKVFLEKKTNQNLHPTYNKKVIRGKDGRYKSIN
jgi:cytochrome bd-type quinol oxidase subunit 2